MRADSGQRAVLDSRPFQRLRHIHQLAMTYQLYPAATHKRFEHSLGVMELAGRVFDIVTHPANVTDGMRKLLPELDQRDKLVYWRRVLRMAALCHDMGHLPFSHAAEDLLPEGWSHERLSREIILSPEMTAIWEASTPPLRPLDIVKLAVGPNDAPDLPFSTWEIILAEIIVGDSFGVDRMDYPLRDSHHVGVVYGKFDHFRLIDTLRILPSPAGPGTETAGEPVLGVEEGGIYSAEALLLARHFMYTQVYFHPIRRIYDLHLKDFLVAWLPGGKFSKSLDIHLRQTDNEVQTAISTATAEPALPGHEAALCLATHRHSKLLYQRHPNDTAVNLEAAQLVADAARKEFGDDRIRYDRYKQKKRATVFPVLTKDGRIASSVDLSEMLLHLPQVAVDFVFVATDKLKDAKQWLDDNRKQIILPKPETA